MYKILNEVAASFNRSVIIIIDGPTYACLWADFVWKNKAFITHNANAILRQRPKLILALIFSPL